MFTRDRYFQMCEETIAKGSNYRAIRAWLEVDPQSSEWGEFFLGVKVNPVLWCFVIMISFFFFSPSS
jgi:hypothetical protein